MGLGLNHPESAHSAAVVVSGVTIRPPDKPLTQKGLGGMSQIETV